MPHGYYSAMMQDAMPPSVDAQLSSSNKRTNPVEYHNDYIPHNKTARTNDPYYGGPPPPPSAVPPPVSHGAPQHHHHQYRPRHAQPMHPSRMVPVRHPAYIRPPVETRHHPAQHSPSGGGGDPTEYSAHTNGPKHFVRSYGPSSKYQVCLLVPSDVHPQINWAGRLIGQKGATIKHLRAAYSVNVFINTPNAPPNDKSYDPGRHPDHVKICATGGTLSDCMNRVAQCVAEIEERFDPTWRDPNLTNTKLETHDIDQPENNSPSAE